MLFGQRRRNKEEERITVAHTLFSICLMQGGVPEEITGRLCIQEINTPVITAAISTMVNIPLIAYHR